MSDKPNLNDIEVLRNEFENMTLEQLLINCEAMLQIATFAQRILMQRSLPLWNEFNALIESGKIESWK